MSKKKLCFFYPRGKCRNGQMCHFKHKQLHQKQLSRNDVTMVTSIPEGFTFPRKSVKTQNKYHNPKSNDRGIIGINRFEPLQILEGRRSNLAPNNLGDQENSLTSNILEDQDKNLAPNYLGDQENNLTSNILGDQEQNFAPKNFQDQENNLTPNVLGDEGNEPANLHGSNYQHKIINKSVKKTVKVIRNQNPTGNIWDQKSLYINVLFEQASKQHFTIGVWNATSVREKEELTKEYIIEKDLDIFIILESWLHQDELPSIVDILPSIEGYKLHQLPRPDRQNASGGGMLCIYKHNIKVEKLQSVNMKLLETMDIKLSADNKTIRLVSVYRPPRTKSRVYPVSDFYDDMESLVSFYKTVNDEVIFCGDYNVHVNKPEQSEVRKFHDILETADLKQLVKGITHEKGNTLDLIITESKSQLIHNCRIDEFLSDHAVILMYLNLTKPPKAKKKISFRNNKQVNLELLERQISENLDKIGDVDNLDELVEKFNKALYEAYNEQAPLKSKIIIIRPPTPWSHDDIKKDKATRRRLERIWRHTGLQVDWEIYRDFRNYYKNKLDDLRNKQYAEMIEKNKDDPTTLFKIINKSLHRKQASPFPSGLSDNELANTFSQFIEEKIDKIRETKMEDQMNFQNLVTLSF